jgi:UDP-N-acetylglucosamine 3-dehydrogenase
MRAFEEGRGAELSGSRFLRRGGMTVDKVRVGILGLGEWGASHLEAYRSLPNVEVVMLCDPREERLRELADRHRVAGRSTNEADLWERGDVDLVSVVNYEKDHLNPVMKALGSGKHAIVEKPISTRANEARGMMEAAAESGKYLVPGHVLRFEPRHAQLRGLLGSGGVGDPVSIYSKRARPRRLFDTFKRVHTVFGSMIHDIDLAIWYTGSRVASVRAFERSVSGADSPEVLWACLEFESGALAVLHSNWMTPDEAGVDVADSVEVIGTDGSASLETVGAAPELWTGTGRRAYELGHHANVDGLVVGALRGLLGYVCGCISDGESPSRVPLEDAVHGVEVAEAVKRSAKTGGEIGL